MRQPIPSEAPALRPLAVVGLAVRYPGDAVSPETFWQMMIDRRCASSRYPADRLNIDAHYNPTGNRLDSLSIDGGHFLTGDMGTFDAAFFSLTATEAECMDPQQRMSLELCYQALENAGFPMEKASGTKTCVFTGCAGNDYGSMHAKDPQFAVDPGTTFGDIVSSWSSPVRSSTDPTLAFVFTGQGAQWPTMGHVLQKEAGECSIDEPKFAQPLYTASQIALVDLLSSWRLRPTAVVGHSSGEIAAAYCAGAISREYALRLAYFRGVVGSKVAGSSSMQGSMMAASLSETQAHPYLDALRGKDGAPRVVIACINSPSSVTLSGHRESLEQLYAQLTEEKVFARFLPVSVAYHSFQMQEVAAAYEAAVGDDENPPPAGSMQRGRRMISSVHGNLVKSVELSKASYWVSNLVSPVRFVDALKRFQLGHADIPTKKMDGFHRETIGIDSFLEIGPHTALRGPCRDSLAASATGTKLEYLPTIMRKANAVQTILDTAARLHCLGHGIDLTAVNSLPEGKKPVPKLLTDLPSYSFNHSKSYWREGRISKGFRFRRFGRHELLGWPDDDWNPLLAKWSNILQPADPVWVQDHKIDNVILPPGASMITMAIEAIKQVVDPDTVVTGYELKNVNFLSALKVSAGGSGAETRFYLRPQSSGTAGSTSWWEFTLCSYEGSWVKNCVGSIKAVMHAASKAQVDSQLQDMSTVCTTPLDPTRFYDMLGSFGYQFGPAFSRISGITSDLSHRLVTNVLPYSGSHPHWSEQYTIHPTTLDALMQTVPLLRSHGGTQKIPISIPSHIERAWLSNTGLSSPGRTSIKVGTTIKHFGRQECESDISVWDQKGQDSLISMEGVVFTSIGSQPDSGQNGGLHASKCQRVEWKPDLDLMLPAEIEEYCASGVSEVGSPGIQSINIDTIVQGYISRAIDLLNGKEMGDMSVETQRYVNWLTSQRSMNEQSGIQLPDDSFNELCFLVSSTGAQGKLYVETGEALLQFARGEIASLDVSRTHLVEAAYSEKWKSAPGAQRWHKYLDAIAHKKPGMSILEIHGSTGSIAGTIIETLRQHSGEPNQVLGFQQLDIAGSDGAISALQEKFSLPTGRVAAKDVDLQNLAQDVEEQYDLIILNLAISDPASQQSSLTNTRSMLKPDPQSLRRCFISGPPSGWDKNSQMNSNKADWQSMLRSAGFSESILVFPDYTDRLSHEIDITISTVEIEGSSQPQALGHVILVTNEGSVAQQHFAKSVEGKLDGYRVEHLPLGQALPATTTPESIVCVLCEIENAILSGLQQPLFQQLQQMFISSHRVLWVNNGAGRESSPFFRMADGLFRVLNSEYDGRTFATVAIENSSFSPALVTRVIQSILSSSSTGETEYVERSGALHIPRLVESTQVSQALADTQPGRRTTLQPWNAETARKLALDTPGLLDSLHFVEDTDRTTALPDDTLEVKVKAVGVNFRDLLVLLGRMDQTVVGFECAGIVTRVGADCSDFKIGDHVVASSYDTYRSYARVHRDATVQMPQNMSFTDAAAIPINFVTAWHGLSVLANVQPGETVLIHSAAGGTGQAAVQVAQFLGAKVIVTAGSAQKKNLLMDLYNIPETSIFSSRNADFVSGVKGLTGGQGVDVVLNRSLGTC
ncbi:hypothetical protein BJX99DRAFT_262160 [Aspergillus californicus]